MNIFGSIEVDWRCKGTIPSGIGFTIGSANHFSNSVTRVDSGWIRIGNNSNLSVSSGCKNVHFNAFEVFNDLSH